jgi:cytochrome c oxidase subunit 2
VAEDITRHEIEPDKVVNISIKDHKFQLPQIPVEIKCGEKVLFKATSEDLMYGFGLFRQDGSLVTQMQVNPHRVNDLLWTFRENGEFDLVSTEYSGPKMYDEKGKDLMRIEKAVVVTGCKEKVAMNRRIK